MHPTRDNQWLPHYRQQNVLSGSTGSVAGHEPLVQTLSATQQCPYNAHSRSQYSLDVQHDDQPGAIRVSDHSPIYTLSSAIHLDPSLLVGTQEPVHEPFPVQASADVRNRSMELESIPDSNSTSPSYQPLQYLTPLAQPTPSPAGNPHCWTPPFASSHPGDESQLNDPRGTNHVPSNCSRGYYDGDTIQSSIMLAFDQRVLHSRMTRLAANYPPVAFPPLPTYPPIGFQPRPQNDGMTLQDFGQEPPSKFPYGLHSATQPTPVIDTHPLATTSHPPLPPAFSAHKAKEPQNGVPNGTQQSSLLCRICGAGPFKRAHERNRHENSVHVEPRWQCELCGHRFSRKDIMERHKKRHTLGVERR